MRLYAGALQAVDPGSAHVEPEGAFALGLTETGRVRHDTGVWHNRCLTWGLAGTAVDKEARKKFSMFVCNSLSIETPVSSDEDLTLHDWAIDLDTGLWVRWGTVKEDEAKHLGQVAQVPLSTPMNTHAER